MNVVRGIGFLLALAIVVFVGAAAPWLVPSSWISGMEHVFSLFVPALRVIGVIVLVAIAVLFIGALADYVNPHGSS